MFLHSGFFCASLRSLARPALATGTSVAASLSTIALKCITTVLDSDAGDITGDDLFAHGSSASRSQSLSRPAKSRCRKTSVGATTKQSVSNPARWNEYHLFDVKLWLNGSQNFELWVRATTTQMAEHLCADSQTPTAVILRAAASLCSLSVAAAQTMFPFLVVHILMTKGTDPFTDSEVAVVGSDDFRGDGPVLIGEKISQLFLALLKSACVSAVDTPVKPQAPQLDKSQRSCPTSQSSVQSDLEIPAFLVAGAPSEQCLRTIVATIQLVQTAQFSGLLGRNISNCHRATGSPSPSLFGSPLSGSQQSPRAQHERAKAALLRIPSELVIKVALRLQLPLVALQTLEYVQSKQSTSNAVGAEGKNISQASSSRTLHAEIDESCSAHRRTRSRSHSPMVASSPLASSIGYSLDPTSSWNQSSRKSEVTKHLLLEIFTQRGDVDNALGVNNVLGFGGDDQHSRSQFDVQNFSIADDMATQLELFENAHLHAQSIVHRDILLGANTSHDGNVGNKTQQLQQEHSLLRSLHKDGMFSTLAMCVRGLATPVTAPTENTKFDSMATGLLGGESTPSADSHDSAFLDELQFQLAARLGRWEIPASLNAERIRRKPSLNQSLFFSTRALIAQDYEAFLSNCHNAEQAILGLSQSNWGHCTDSGHIDADRYNFILHTVASSHHSIQVTASTVRASPSCRVLFDNFRILNGTLPISNSDTGSYVQMQCVADLKRIWTILRTNDTAWQRGSSPDLSALVNMSRRWKKEIDNTISFDCARPLLDARLALLQLIDTYLASERRGSFFEKRRGIDGSGAYAFFAKQYFMSAYAAFARRVGRSTVCQRILLDMEKEMNPVLQSHSGERSGVEFFYGLDKFCSTAKQCGDSGHGRKRSSSAAFGSPQVPDHLSNAVQTPARKENQAMFALLVKAKLALENACCCWARREPSRAIFIARSVANSLQGHLQVLARTVSGFDFAQSGDISVTDSGMQSSFRLLARLVHAESSFQAGKWLAERQVLDTSQIFQTFFNTASNHVNHVLDHHRFAASKHIAVAGNRARDPAHTAPDTFFGLPFVGFDSPLAFQTHARAMQSRILYVDHACWVFAHVCLFRHTLMI